MEFTGKFETLIETAITRNTQGGILTGDIVVIRKDVFKHSEISKLPQPQKDAITHLMGTDLTLRAGAIKSQRSSNTGMNTGTRAPADYFVDVSIETAPGLWSNPTTLPIEVLDIVDSDGNLAKVPDSVKRKSVSEKPKEAKSFDSDRKNPISDTRQSNIGSTTDGKAKTKKPVVLKSKGSGHPTLESVYESMFDENNGGEYTIAFGEPYGQNPDEIINKIQSMPGLSNNMSASFSDDYTLELHTTTDLSPKEIENMISNIVKGTVIVTGSEDIEPQSADISTQAPSLGM